MIIKPRILRILIIICLLIGVKHKYTRYQAEAYNKSEYFCIQAHNNTVVFLLNENMLKSASFVNETGKGFITKEDMKDFWVFDLNKSQYDDIIYQNEDISFYLPNLHTVENDEMGTWLTERHLGQWWCYTYRVGSIIPPYISSIIVTHYNHFFKTKDGFSFEVDKKAVIQNPTQVDLFYIKHSPIFKNVQNDLSIELYPLIRDMYLLYISGSNKLIERYIFLNNSYVTRFQSYEKDSGIKTTCCVIDEDEAVAIMDGSIIVVN